MTLPAVGAAVGLLAGMVCRPASLPEVKSERESAGETKTAAQAGTSLRAARHAGSTTLFLNELATAPASRCEELFREIASRKDPKRRIEMEAVFRRWMELEEPKELLARLEAEEDSKS